MCACSYPVPCPTAAAVAQGVGQQQAVARRRQIEDPLGHDKAHPEEEVAGGQEGDQQQHQAQSQRPEHTPAMRQLSCVLLCKECNY